MTFQGGQGSGKDIVAVLLLQRAQECSSSRGAQWQAGNKVSQKPRRGRPRHHRGRERQLGLGKGREQEVQHRERDR